MKRTENDGLKRKLFFLGILWLVSRIFIWLTISQWTPSLDVELYNRYASGIFAGQIPYIDFYPEYPPGALLVFLLPGFLSEGLLTYNKIFIVFTIIIEGLTIILMAIMMKKMKCSNLILASIGTLIATNVFLGHVFFQRFDLVPAFLTLLILYGSYFNKRWIAWASLGAGFAIKLYPLVLAPLVFLNFVLKGQRSIKAYLKEGFKGLLWAGGIVLILWGPFWWAARDNFFSFLSYHSHRGLQLESIYANFIELTSPFSKVTSEFGFGAWHLQSPAAAVIAKYSLLIMAVFYFIIYLLIYKRYLFNNSEDFSTKMPELFAIVIMTFIFTSKVFSPQFLIWVIPFVLLSGHNQKERLTYRLLVIGLAGLTLFVFPVFYKQLVLLQPSGITILTGRNLLLLILYYFLIRKGLAKSPSKNIKEI